MPSVNGNISYSKDHLAYKNVVGKYLQLWHGNIMVHNPITQRRPSNIADNVVHYQSLRNCGPWTLRKQSQCTQLWPMNIVVHNPEYTAVAQEHCGSKLTCTHLRHRNTADHNPSVQNCGQGTWRFKIQMYTTVAQERSDSDPSVHNCGTGTLRVTTQIFTTVAQEPLYKLDHNLQSSSSS